MPLIQVKPGYDIDAPAWWRRCVQLAAETARDGDFRRWLAAFVAGPRLDLSSPLEQTFKYHFDGGLASWRESRRRGWCACAEVGAYAAAAASVLWPDDPCWGLIEGEQGSDLGYSHLRVKVGAVIVDPFAGYARTTEARSIDSYALMTVGGQFFPMMRWHHVPGGLPL